MRNNPMLVWEHRLTNRALTHVLSSLTTCTFEFGYPWTTVSLELGCSGFTSPVSHETDLELVPLSVCLT